MKIKTKVRAGLASQVAVIGIPPIVTRSRCGTIPVVRPILTTVQLLA